MMIHQQLLAGLILGATLSTAHAQMGLPLSGDIIGSFRTETAARATAAPWSDGWSSSYRIGEPMNHSFQSGVSFNGHNFTDIGNGGILSAGLFSYYNGVNRPDTSSGSALLDLFWQPAWTSDLIPLTTINFGLDATANLQGKPVADTFRASFVQPEPVRLGNEWVKFTFDGLPDLFQLAENSKVDLGSFTIAVIPEPSTDAVLLGLAILSFAVRARQRALSAA